MAFGVPILEELAAFFTVGRTTSQLFFTDGDRSDPPLLLRMASDCSDGLFMYASQPYEHTMSFHNTTFLMLPKSFHVRHVQPSLSTVKVLQFLEDLTPSGANLIMLG